MGLQAPLDPGLKQSSSPSLSTGILPYHIGSLPISEPITAAAEKLRADWPEVDCVLGGGGASLESVGPEMEGGSLRTLLLDTAELTFIRKSSLNRASPALFASHVVSTESLAAPH